MLDSDFRIERVWTSCAEPNLSHEITRIRNEVKSGDKSEMRLAKWDCWNKLVASGPKIGPATSVRTRGSTPWRHRWQEAIEFLCTKTPLLERVEQQKISPNKSENAFSDALLMLRFQYLIRGQRFWEVIFFTDYSPISFPIFPTLFEHLGTEIYPQEVVCEYRDKRQGLSGLLVKMCVNTSDCTCSSLSDLSSCLAEQSSQFRAWTFKKMCAPI